LAESGGTTGQFRDYPKNHWLCIERQFGQRQLFFDINDN